MPTVHTPDAVLRFEQTGAGPDVLWLAAGDQPGHVWREFQTPAFPDLRNTTYDARGVGGTDSNVAPPWSIEDHAADAAALIRTVCQPPVTLVGLSMGSLIAQELALSHPELVRCAIIMGTCARKTGFMREWEEAEIAFRRNGAGWPSALAIAHYALLMYPAEVLGDDELWARVRPIVARDYGQRDDAALAAQWQACLDYDSTERLPRCSVPLHVIAFSQDVQTPPQRGRQVAELAPQGTFHLLEGLGHASALGHRPDAVNKLIREILSSV
jgi:pimeloyl-ACP methyl ester carboxylesterase